MAEKFWENNIVIIGSRDKTEQYIFGIIKKMNPSVYDKKGHECIIIQIRESLLDYFEFIKRLVKWIGLKETSRIKKAMDVGDYTLQDAYEIKLEKIPVLQMMRADDEDG